MRTITLALLLLLVAIFSCNGPGPAIRPTGGDLLSSTFFDVNPDKDTALTTPGGIIIRLPAGTLDANGAASIRLEVKEAFTPDEMIRGKLVDHNNGGLLSSGVLFFNVATGQNATIRRPVKVSVPVKYPSNGVMVYDGQVDDSLEVDWLNPQPLANNPAVRQLNNGKVIFLTNCASCHSLRGDAGGPPLAWITARRDKKWLFEFTRNNARMLWRGDAYSCYLFNRYNKRPMEVFPDLSDSALESLYRYIDIMSLGIDSNSVPDRKRSFDSCAKNDPRCTGVSAKTNPPTDAAATPTATTPNYYDFALDKFGWYNIAQRSDSAPAPTSEPTTTASTDNAQAQLQACPCWCDESAYRKADSVARARPAAHP